MSSLEKEKQSPNWADRHSGKLFLGVIALFAAGLFHICWTSDVEDALLQGIKEQGWLAVYVEAVQCDTPKGGLVACEVTYVEDTTLSPVKVKVDVAKAPFPAEFNVFLTGNRRDLRTSFEGHEMGIQSGVTALRASLDAATAAADSSLGPKLQAGLNALSYSLGEEVPASKQRIDVPPEAAKAALAAMSKANK